MRYCFILLICCLTAVTSAATNIHVATNICVEWVYTPPSEPTIMGYNLYQEGFLACQNQESQATFMDCQVTLIEPTTNFTLTVAFIDGTESPHSAPFAFSIETSIRNKVQQLYVGYFARAADQMGLDYWVNEISSGALSLEQLRSHLVNEQPEFKAIYGNMTRRELIAQIYLNLFMRAPEPNGEAYWTTGGGAGVNADQLVVAFINAASPSDRQVFENAVRVADYYTAKLGDPAHFDADKAAAAIAQVDGTNSSVMRAIEIIDSWSGF